jgi:hypothetical protein
MTITRKKYVRKPLTDSHHQNNFPRDFFVTVKRLTKKQTEETFGVKSAAQIYWQSPAAVEVDAAANS